MFMGVGHVGRQMLGAKVGGAMVSASPTLDLTFVDGSNTLDPRITFTRPSTATYFDATGTMQTATMNLILQSQFAGSWAVVADATLTPNVITAPDSTMTGAMLKEGSVASTVHGIQQSVAKAASVITYTISVYLKAGAGSRGLQFQIDDGGTNGVQGVINSATGAVIIALSPYGTGWSSTPFSYVAASGGWGRVSFSVTSGVQAGIRSVLIMTLANGNATYTGDNVSNIQIYGYQLEVGSVATTYVPTTTAANGAPRFDCDPVTHAALGLLIEEARTNVLLQSSNFANGAVWPAAGITAAGPTITGNAVTAPDGTVTAAQVVFPAVSGAGNASIVFQSITTTANAYTASVYMRGAVGGEQLYLMASTVPAYFVRVTLTTAWQRFTLSMPAPAASGAFFEIGCDLRIAGVTSISAQTIYVWGAQLEQGALTSYIPTTAAAVTRAVDVANITPLGAWFNASTGSLVGEFDTTGAGTAVVAGFSSGAFADTLFQEAVSSTTSANVVSVAYNATASAIALTGVLQKMSATYSVGRLAACNNGLAVQVIGTLPAGPYLWTANLGIGSAPWALGAAVLNGHIRRVRYWPRVLSNAEMQSVTT